MISGTGVLLAAASLPFDLRLVDFPPKIVQSFRALSLACLQSTVFFHPLRHMGWLISLHLWWWYISDVGTRLRLIVPKAIGPSIIVSTSTTTRPTNERGQEVESPSNANEKVGRVQRVSGGVEEAKVLIFA